MTEKTNNQPNINEQQQKLFSDMIQQGIKEGGIHLNASKGFGKTRLLFSMAQCIRQIENSRVFIFDGSLAWLYGFSRIPVLNINEEDITLSEVKTIEEIETYALNNWQFVKMALQTHRDLLFRVKTRKPSKRGFFIRTVINYLDAQQRAEIEQSATHEPKNTNVYFIEESQDAFNSRSQTRLESEEFLTVFNEARNQKESFFTASQRLNDFSKTIRTKQIYCLGRINSEDMTPALRHLEKDQNIDLSKMALRNWLFNGAVFISPEFKQQGKPYIINRQLRTEFSQTKKYPSVLKASIIALFGLTDWYESKHQELYENQTAPDIEDPAPETPEPDESELDLTMTDGNDNDCLFPTDPE